VCLLGEGGEIDWRFLQRERPSCHLVTPKSTLTYFSKNCKPSYRTRHTDRQNPLKKKKEI
jgi:hypothetical protein